MPRKSDEEKLADLQKLKDDIRKQLLTVNRDMRAVRSRQRGQTERTRNHVGIVVGLGLIEHARRNPDSEVRRVMVRIAENHLQERPGDKPVADLLAELKVVPEVPADPRPAEHQPDNQAAA